MNVEGKGTRMTSNGAICFAFNILSSISKNSKEYKKKWQEDYPCENLMQRYLKLVI